MSYLIVTLTSLLLLTSFVGWSLIETRQGFRIVGPSRKRFDRQVARATFVIEHIDWQAFFAHIAKSSAERVAHDVVHTTLLMVRALERTLTRIIRILRVRVATNTGDDTPVEGSRLIATIIKFRKSFKRELPASTAEVRGSTSISPE